MSSYSQDDILTLHPAPLTHAPTSTIATALLFGSITFATATLAARLWLAGLWSWRDGGRPFWPSSSYQTQPLDETSLPSIYNLLHHSSVFGFILLYSYICENHPPYPHEEKAMYDRDEFLFCIIIVVLLAGGRSWRCHCVGVAKDGTQQTNRMSKGTVSDLTTGHRKKRGDGINVNEDYTTGAMTAAVAPLPSADNDVLNRHQTEEWKGWMQFTFLLYHYIHATEVYNGIRVLITCYLWLTGFDYSLPRVLQMLWRLNFLVVFLCLTHGNSYILYYICPLHTFFFLIVYALMYVGKDKNYNKWWIRFKIGVLALMIYSLWDIDWGFFEAIHRLFLGEEPTAGAPFGTLWEWYFRSYLDHWSALLGMVFALNAPIVSLFYRKLEARSVGRQWIGKLSVLAGMMYAFVLWVHGPFMMEKEAYNETNPYFGFIPLILYVYVRNLTPTFRSHSMELLQEIGKTTLETYLMQHHVWLTSNSKTVLVFIPRFPRLNMLVVTFCYVKICRKLHNLTSVLRNVLLPHDRNACVRCLTSMSLVICGFYLTAFILDRIHVISLSAVGIVSVICGGLLYQAVMDSTWSEYHNAVKKAREDEDDDEDTSFADKSDVSYYTAGDLTKESIIAKLCPPIIGVMFLFVLGSIWNEIAFAGASSVGALPPQCAEFVNDGSWIPVDTCNESSRGMAYRNHHVASFGTCSLHGASFIWAWKEQPARTHCRFGLRGKAKLKRLLIRRHVLFIGDSMTRNLYHASLRAMGVREAGAYDATIPKHTDLNEVMWDTTPVNFKWAPLAVDQLNSLRGVNNIALNGGDIPDLIVMGGGAWDRLHVYATDEDRQSHAATLRDLAHEMLKSQELGMPVVWTVPTTINSQALNTEEKRDHMREEDMEAMRAVYSLNGILASSSFVIDGTAFTSSRVSESFDGVHYPHEVYDAGAQILFQALDWLLPENTDDIVTAPNAGKMSNPTFGFIILTLVAIGLVSFDGFLGFSYLASFFVKGVKPCDLYDDASPESAPSEQQTLVLKRNLGLIKTRQPSPFKASRRTHNESVDDEIAALLR
eukprot:CCRYP_000772-RB/>CCRYP_000772-RB protein AED:0.08 eAED:0.08 QI:194/0.75/0.8/1/1/1/5/77/1048